MKNPNIKKVKEWNIIMHDIEAKYYEDRHHEIFNKSEINLALTFFKKVGHVQYLMDVGAGTGVLTKIATKYSKKVIAMDISMNMLLKCRSNLSDGNVEFILADAENLPFKENVFECVIASSVLHHIPDYKKFLSEAFLVLKQGGFLHIQHEPNARFRELRKSVLFSFSFSFITRLLSVVHFLKKKIRCITNPDQQATLQSGKEFSEKVLNQLKAKSLNDIWLVTDIHESRGFEPNKIKQILEEIGYYDIQKFSYNTIHPMLYSIYPELLLINARKKDKNE